MLFLSNVHSRNPKKTLPSQDRNRREPTDCFPWCVRFSTCFSAMCSWRTVFWRKHAPLGWEQSAEIVIREREGKPGKQKCPGCPSTLPMTVCGSLMGMIIYCCFLENESMTLSMIASLRFLSPKPKMMAIAAPRPIPIPHAIGVTNV